MLADYIGQLGFVRFEPNHGPVKSVESLKGMKAFVGHNSDTGATVGEGNNPGAIARAHQMISTQSAGLVQAISP